VACERLKKSDYQKRNDVKRDVIVPNFSKLSDADLAQAYRLVRELEVLICQSNGGSPSSAGASRPR
jgi:hypothetical protein